MPKIKRLIGTEIENYIVLKEYKHNKKNFVTCICNCGKSFTTARTNVSGKRRKKSCGCLLRNDLVGKKFNRWTVIKYLGHKNYNYKYWCKCDCGKEKSVDACALKNGASSSCRCYGSEQVSKAVKKDLTGFIFSGLHVIRADGNQGKFVKWMCECRCGRFVSVMAKNLLNGGATKCGKCTRVYKYYPFWEAPPTRRRKNPNNLYAQWRKAIFKKYNFKCVVCSKNGGIVAHHLNGWNWCESGRYDINNGCVLCIECHDNFHKKYGCGDNTKAQFEEYLIEQSKLLQNP